MLREDQTCPKCGALVTPQLDRCRQCNTYLHGTPLEGLLVEALLPKGMVGAPGTGLIAVYAMMTYLLMILLTGPEALAGFRPLALLQLGSTVSTEVQDLEPWRFVSSMFVHGDLIHLLMNLYALSIVGPLVESLHDRKRIIVFFVLGGTFSMLGSYCLHICIMNEGFFAGSVGASGGVSCLLGVGWVTSRRIGSTARDANSQLGRWIVFLLLWGFIPGIDGAAHFFGLVAGALFGWLIPEGPPRHRSGHRIWTFGALASLSLVLGSSALTLAHALDQPYRLEDDLVPRSLLFFEIEPGTPWTESGQFQAANDCLLASKGYLLNGESLERAIDRCELAVRAVPSRPEVHLLLATVLEDAGNKARADRQRRIAERLRAN